MRSLAIAFLGAVSLAACAQAPSPAAKATARMDRTATSTAGVKPVAGTPEARAVAAVRTLSPQAQVDQVGAAAIPGFREVVVGGQVAYVSDDGRYMFVPGMGGALYDTARNANLTETSLSKLRRTLLQTIPASDRIVFAPANAKYHVTVFTDVSCAYCRKLHSEIAEYNRQGIAIEYVAYPRAGLGSPDFQQMVSVWCATDRRKALTDAKNDRPVPQRNCANPVTAQYDIGQRAGLTGTPMILAEDGSQLGGYVPPDRLRLMLDQRAAEQAKPAS